MKRSIDARNGHGSDDEVQIVEVQKKAKIAPIFASARSQQNGSAGTSSASTSAVQRKPFSTASTAAAGSSSDSGISIPLPASLPKKINWSTFGPSETCLVGRYGEPAAEALGRLDSGSASQKKVCVAMFDLDWTLVKPSGGKKWPNPKDEYDFVFLYANIVKKVQEAYQSGHIIAIVSNQYQSSPAAAGKKGKSDFKPAETVKMQAWQKKLVNICTALRVPCYIFSAMAKDVFRKPHWGMWDAFLNQWINELGRSKDEIAKTGRDSLPHVSYYVGDFAGRSGDGEAAKDHKDTDRKFAINVGLKFHTPEEYFLGAKRNTNFKLEGFDAKAFLSKADSTSEYKPSFPPASQVEVVLFVGPPGSGKSTFYDRHFKAKNYEWVNQDTLHSRDRCIKAVSKYLQKGKSCVVDNTNRDKATRAYYVNLAKQHSAKIRCFVWSMDLEQAWHQNLYRAFETGSKTKPIPGIGYTSYRSAYQPPVRSEGFSEDPVNVPFKFQGTHAQRERFAMWYATMEDFR